jgi:hypothetical protein
MSEPNERSTALAEREVLSCRIKGFYPFPGDVPMGVLGYIFKDIHQAVSVRTSGGSERLIMDFMTEGGPAHPVWWDEAVKRQVFLGANIRGEVRIRRSGKSDTPNSKLERLTQFAVAYGQRPLNLYFSNCRMFCARVEREAERLTAEDQNTDGQEAKAAAFAADSRLACALLSAGLLPFLYPAMMLAFCWSGISYQS